MKYRWRIGRMIAGMLLSTLTGLAFWYWPASPRWQVEQAVPVGFELNRRLLLAHNIPKPKQGLKLSGYDLETGELKVSIPIPIETSDEGKFLSWKIMVSNDGKKLVCWHDRDCTILIFALDDNCRQLMKINPNRFGMLDSIGISKQGDMLGFRFFDEVQIWDIDSARLKCKLRMPEDSLVGVRTGVWLCHPDGLRFSGDNKYLAVAGDNQAIVVFDLTSESEIGECKLTYRNTPHFLPDNKTLVTSGDRYATEVKWYSVGNHQLQLLPIALDTEQHKNWVMAVVDQSIFTGAASGRNPWELPAWIPKSVEQFLRSMLDGLKESLQVQQWDARTGLLTDSYRIPYRDSMSSVISSDGRVLAVHDLDGLSLWDIPPRRSTACWIVCCTTAIVSLCMFWGSRTKSKCIALRQQFE